MLAFRGQECHSSWTLANYATKRRHRNKCYFSGDKNVIYQERCQLMSLYPDNMDILAQPWFSIANHGISNQCWANIGLILVSASCWRPIYAHYWLTIGPQPKVDQPWTHEQMILVQYWAVDKVILAHHWVNIYMLSGIYWDIAIKVSFPGTEVSFIKDVDTLCQFTVTQQ